MSYRLKSRLAGALIVGLILGLGATFLGACSENRDGDAPSVEGNTPVRVEFEAEYIALTREQMIDQADLIFLGEVSHISPTRWNQDSGEYWDDDETRDLYDTALPYHEIELIVIQPIVDAVGVEEQVIITVLGNSPVGPEPQTGGFTVIVAGAPSHDLKVGDRVVVFARQGEIAWRGGMRPAILLMGVPRDSYLIQGEDGLYHHRQPDVEEPVSLEALSAHIARRRETLVQP
ncbi:MAG: hypothetical protein N2508_02580 [Anaerolineae bacterium]|nr:hypothetical protein [Anaerolineae bacterium]